MTNDYYALRREITDKAELLRWPEGKCREIDFRRLFGATDSLYESALAADSYEQCFRNDPRCGVLVAYGYLQALFVMQDAVRQLHKAVFGEKSDLPLHKHVLLGPIRSARNRIAGHPSRACKETNDGLGISSAFFPFDDLKVDTFKAVLYLEEGNSEITIHVDEWRKNNKLAIVEFMKPILERINQLDTNSN